MSNARKHRGSHTINYNIEEKYLPINSTGSTERGVVERRQELSNYGNSGGICQRGVAGWVPNKQTET